MNRGSTRGVRGLDHPERYAKASEGSQAKHTSQPVSPEASTEEPKAEVDTIEEFEERVREVEKLVATREESGVPMVPDVRTPTQEEVDQHNLTHAQYQPWCPHCNKGLAARDAHRRKRKKGYKYGRFGEIKVPDTEANEDGVTKFSMDYAKLKSHDQKKDPSRVTPKKGDLTTQ